MTALFNRLVEAARIAWVSFKLYTVSDIIRGKSGIISLAGISLWLILIILPVSLFANPQIGLGRVAAFIFGGILVFNVYSVATWDWAWEIRKLINYNVLEHLIASGKSPLMVYLGLIPVSLIWLLMIIVLGYGVVNVFVAQPEIVISDLKLLILAFTLLIIVVLSYALVLASTILISGTSGAIVEIFSWVLPLATGGFIPLSLMPESLRTLALLTPFSYPAELLRKALNIYEPILPTNTMFIIGYIYGLAFLTFSITLFKLGIRKTLKEGLKTLSAW
ncbi:MAG: ABC transporter permease [Thermoprotei archaeon]|nr:MAG: ABC transporter permease [Thermoprotei archaeon]